MSALPELVEAGERLVLTGEAPAIDGGDARRVQRAHRGDGAWVDAMNATDNTAAHAHASNVAVRDRDRAGGRRADPAGRLPGQEPARLPGRHRRGGAARRREHLLPDRRRRHRRRRAGGPARLRPRRPAARSASPPALARGPLPLRAPARPAAAAVRRRGREPGRAAARLPRRAGGEEDPGRRAVPPAPDLLPPRPARGVRRRRCDAQGLTARAALLPTIVLVEGARALAFMDEQVPGIDVPAETIAPRRAGGGPGRGGVPARARAGPRTRSRCPASAACT